jgi:hypothetical protein
MSDDRLEQEGDVELHKKSFKTSDETGADDDADVEGHKKAFKAIDEPGSDDDSDDVEAHRKSFK